MEELMIELEDIVAAAVEGAADAVHDITSSTDEDKIREWMKTWVAYAEDGPSFDPAGKYLCGTCAVRIDNGKRNGNECAPMSGFISFEAGSCRMYVHGPDKEATEPYKHQLTQIEAQYGERPKAKGFGCSRCEYGSKAKEVVDGRPSWCSYFNVHVQPLACCAMNEGPDSIQPKEVKAASETSLESQHKDTLWNGIKIIGFSGPEEEGLRAMLSRIPPELLFNVQVIKAAPELNAKHGRYEIDTKTVSYNPHNFELRQRFGKGDSWIYHPELTAVHEIGHSIYRSLNPEQQKTWEDISGWMEGWKPGQSTAYHEKRPGWGNAISDWTHKAGIKFTRHYAERNPDEDFADSWAFVILGKGFQMEPAKKDFIDSYIKAHVHAYPSVLIESPIKAEENLYNIYGGGPGSGRHKEVEKEKPLSDRAQRAVDSYVAQTKGKSMIARLNEVLVAKYVGGNTTGDNRPFDVTTKNVGIEVKTMFRGTKNEKFTMHPESLARKIKEAKTLKVKTWTVGIDMRDTKKMDVYIKSGLGSFRLGSMQKIESIKDLGKYIK